MAADATITALAATLQTEVTGGQALPADILALSSGLVSESTTYAATTLARRVGILAADVNVNAYTADSSLGKTAMTFQECLNSDAFARAATAADSDLGQVRAGLAMSTARTLAIAQTTLNRAAAFQTLFGTTLPA
jgi:hypothetical protein